MLLLFLVALPFVFSSCQFTLNDASYDISSLSASTDYSQAAATNVGAMIYFNFCKNLVGSYPLCSTAKSARALYTVVAFSGCKVLGMANVDPVVAPTALSFSQVNLEGQEKNNFVVSEWKASSVGATGTGQGIALSYTGETCANGGNYELNINLECNPSVSGLQMASTNAGDILGCKAYINALSSAACPVQSSSSGLSGGWIFVIIFFVVTVV